MLARGLPVLILAVACIVATGADARPLIFPNEMAKAVDTAAPKYQTAECQAALKNVGEFDENLAGRYVEGAVLGAAFGVLGLPFAANIDRNKEIERENAINQLIANCGQDAFFAYLLKEAQDDNIEAETYLGQSYAKGYGTPQDWAQAAAWYQKAADAGVVAAQVNLGAQYYYGQGVPLDYNKAADLWRMAAVHGSPEAKTDLGEMYAAGKMYDEARPFFEEAAGDGNASAQFQLAEMYETGNGMAKNDVMAYGWYSVAAQNGNADAAAKRDAVAARLSVDQQRGAGIRVGKCIQSHYAVCDF